MLSFKKLILLAVVYGYALFYGRAVQVPSRVQNVLVVQMAKLGDMVCTTPVFNALKKHDPSIRVTVLGNALNKEVLEGNPDVDSYIVFSSPKEVLHAIASQNFDAAILTGGPDFMSTALAYLAHIPCIVVPEIKAGFSPLYDGWFRVLSKLLIRVPHHMGTYAPREYLRLLEPLGIHAEATNKFVFSTTGAIERMTKRVGVLKQPRVGIAPGAGNKIKEWPPERFAELADRLAAQHNASILVFGTDGDAEALNGFYSALAPTTVVESMQGITVDELKASIGMLNLFISADTGPIYIAEAQGIPTIDIVGPIDEREQPPIGPYHMVVVPEGRTEPALRLMRAKVYDKKEARCQARATTVDQVWSVCEDMLKTIV
ncbi:MAG: heptosyltransferase II [Parcubacteria bacterium C7867-007]|nr:MAG: heptosyltransferase II [Parcubacteria bacterium C7867-007]